jgi:hypothetical protein
MNACKLEKKNSFHKMFIVLFLHFTSKREIKILVDAKSDQTEVDLFVSYIVYNASWTPKYDLRVFSKEKSIIVRILFIKNALLINNL